ncbi:MAG: hypothetical protein HYS63_05990 [Methylocystis sp.]|nr:hypothetical protein [Methylocystis sp.]
MLNGLAELERELIHAGASESRSRAKARSVKMGRPYLNRHRHEEARKAFANGAATQTDLARKVFRSTIPGLDK